MLTARIERVCTVSEGPTQQIVDRIADEQHGLLEAPAGITRPVRQAGGHALDFVAVRGAPAAAVDAWADLVRRTPRDAFIYDPARPAPSQRNVVHEIAIDDATGAKHGVKALRAMGVGTSIQMRVLVCDGPLFLEWVGGFVPRERPITPRDRARLATFAQGVKPALRLVSGLQSDLLGETLDTLLEIYPGEAYLLHADGRIVCANQIGAARLSARAHDLHTDLLAAVQHGASTGYDVHPVRQRGMPAMYILTRAPGHDRTLEALVERARGEWLLSQRELDVLSGLARGEANKEIAARLDLSVRTVEVHLTSLLRKASVESRLQLVVRVWQGV